MKNILLQVRRFLVSEGGPTAVEYAVMLAMIVAVCLVSVRAIGTNTKTTFTTVGNSLSSS